MLTPTSGRTENGTFAPGHQLSPQKLSYRYGARAAMIQESMTAEEILALNDDDKALGKRPAIDTIVIRRLARAMKKMEPETCSDIDRAIDGHLDRVEGKAASPQDAIDAKPTIVVQIMKFGSEDILEIKA